MVAEKLDLFKRVLPALDKRKKNFYNSLTDDEKKQYSPFIIMRYMSSNGNGSSHEMSILDANDWVNKHFWVLSKEHKELQHLLLCLC